MCISNFIGIQDSVQTAAPKLSILIACATRLTAQDSSKVAGVQSMS